MEFSKGLSSLTSPAGETPPKTCTAIVADETPALHKQEISVPAPQPYQVLVKISHAAQNPTDVKSFEGKVFGNGAVLGCDFAGTVVAVGDKVTRVKKGDQIAAFIWGGETKGVGAYSEYTLADEKICFRVPGNISPAEAATIPLAAGTVWLAFFSNHSLHIPRDSTQRTSTSILIWGGSSSVGQYAVQIAALHGYTVAATCSPKNFDHVKSLGAAHVFDYKSDDVAEQIKAAVPDLKYVFDTIGTPQSSATASQAVASGTQGVLCTVRPGKSNTKGVVENVKVTNVFVFTAFLKEHQYRTFHWPAMQDDHQLASELYDNIAGWIEAGKLKPNNVVLLKGLDSVEKGFELYKQGKISAEKVVYEL